MLRITDTQTPYKVIPHKGIQYTVCPEYDHISRYQNLRQVIHSPNDVSERFIASETVNPIVSNVEVTYYTVPATEENRLDLISHKFFGTPNYAWIIAYFNNIEDGFTVQEGQKLVIPKTLSSLFNKGELLASVSPFTMNLGSE